MLATLFLAACALQTRAIGLAQASQDEAPMIRSYIQAGGQYAENSAGEHIFQDQIYVEHLVPVHGVTQHHPIVFLHGAAQTATVSGTSQASRDNGRLRVRLTSERIG